jgi:hypothetical protein
MKKLIGGIIVLVIIIGAIAGGSGNKTNSGGSADSAATSAPTSTPTSTGQARVQLIARRSSCFQIPAAAEVSFWFYVRNVGSRAGTYDKNVTPEWTTIDAHTVFSVNNTVTFPQRIPAHDWRVIHANLPADGTKLIISCKALVDDKEVPIRLRD